MTKIKTEQKNEFPATQEIQTFCKKTCLVCQSPHIKEIHSLWKSGKKYSDIIEFLKKEYNFRISKSSLSRHFIKYQERKMQLSAEMINKDLVDEATELSQHTKQIVGLINRALNHIENHAIAFDVSDLEKLFKIRHQILGGDNSGENDLIGIFQKAVDKYGVDINQGILFKPGNK